MSGVLDDPNEYSKNPLYKDREFGDFTAFYITITVCSIFGFLIFLLNIFFCWCSKHSEYWQDSNTGNRWILPIWTKTPHGQPPLDLTELEEGFANGSIGGGGNLTRVYYETVPEEYLEFEDQPKHKRESQL